MGWFGNLFRKKVVKPEEIFLDPKLITQFNKGFGEGAKIAQSKLAIHNEIGRVERHKRMGKLWIEMHVSYLSPALSGFPQTAELLGVAIGILTNFLDEEPGFFLWKGNDFLKIWHEELKKIKGMNKKYFIQKINGIDPYQLTDIGLEDAKRRKKMLLQSL